MVRIKLNAYTLLVLGRFVSRSRIMSTIVPNRFLVRLCHPCPFVAGVPDQSEDAEHLVDLPDAARLNNFADLDGQANFSDVRLAWND